MYTDTTEFNRQSLKQQIIEAVIEILSAAPLEKGAAIDAERLFEIVEVRDPDEFTNKEVPACGLEYGPEETIDLMSGRIDKMFRLYIGIKLRTIKGVDPYKLFNYYAARVIEVCLADVKLGGLTRDLQEAGNSPEINGLDDPLPGGSVFLDVKYRHLNGNPFSKG